MAKYITSIPEVQYLRDRTLQRIVEDQIKEGWLNLSLPRDCYLINFEKIRVNREKRILLNLSYKGDIVSITVPDKPNYISINPNAIN